MSGDQLVGFPIIARYSAEEIGTAGKNWSATQDPDGVMYFGRIGVTTFDGDRWRTWPMRGANAVRGLDLATNGRLWAGGTGEIGWFERSDSRLIYHSLVEHLPEEHRNLGELWDVFANGDGAVFVAENKILRWDGSAFQVWPMPGGGRLRGLRSDGQIYLQQRPSGLHTLSASGLKLILPASTIGDARIWWLERRDDAWMFVTSDGFARLNQGRFEPFAAETSAIIRRALPTCVVDLRDGRLAIGTVNSGILIVRRDGVLERTFDLSDGLPTELINGLFLDRDGQLWAAAHSFIFRLALNPVTTVFDRRAQLPEKPILNIVSNHQRVIASTDTAIYRLSEDGDTFEMNRSGSEPIWDMVYSPEGLLTAGYLGVKRSTSESTTVLRATTGDVFAIEPSRARPGHFLLSEGASLVHLDSYGNAQVLADGLPDIAGSLAEDAEGRIWLGTRQGLLLVDLDSPMGGAHRPSSFAGLPPVRGPTVVSATTEGVVFVFSTAGGWMLAPQARSFVPVAGLPHGDITTVSRAHASDEMWLAFAAGGGRAPTLGRIAIDDDGARWEPHEVESLHVISTPQSILVQKSGDGTRVLWIGGTKGILRQIVEGGPSAPAPRPPLLRAFAYSGRDRAPASIETPLAYSTSRIQFEFAAPEYARRASLRLESFIDGIDEDWVRAGPDSRRELTAVRDGSYRIRVRAVADTGVASTSASLSFQVLPPWWRTTPAAIGAILALLPIAYFSVRLRLRALRRHNAELEEKVRVRTEQLEAASAAKTQFVANMSHDIRNPLNGIVGLTLALEDSRLDTRQREIVATLRECTTYLSTLVDDVLDFASIEAGRVELRPGPFVPGELLTSIVTTLKGDTAERGATFTCSADPRLPGHLLGDAGRIQQILVNFASNALKYAGGDIHLEASCPENAPGEVEFAVTDRGRGISLEEQATLFTKFTRLERSRHDDIPGAGLGLAACRLLADIMGGAVGVESRVGEGARFFLRLPLTIAREAPEPAPASLPNTTVLLVEDTDYNAWAASAVLARLGLTCDRARTGEEAVRMFSEKHYNVVLLDRNLPDMDGTEVARRIRKMDSDGLPAILLAVTAYCTAEDRTLCLDAGMDAFVGKPLTPDKLRRVLLTAGRRMIAAATVDVPRETIAAELDLTLLNYLSDGTEAGVADHVERFLATLSETEAQLATTVAAGDFSALEVHAHRVLGQARMIDAAALTEAALRLEHVAKTGDAAACRETLRLVRDEMRAVTAAMRRPRPSMSTA